MKEKIIEIIENELKNYEFELPKDEYYSFSEEASKKILKLLWVPIDKDNLPEGEVLAGCFEVDDKANFKVKGVGFIYYYSELSDHEFYCKNKKYEFVVINATHFIDINKLDV